MGKKSEILKKIDEGKFCVGIVGMGYVGLPLALCFGLKNFPVMAFDVDQNKVEKLNGGQSYFKHIPSSEVQKMVEKGKFEATADFDRLSEPDALIICVPTPLDQHREPDMSFVVSTTEEISKRLREGQLVSLESTTYPGTTVEVLKPILEKSGLKAGIDFHLAYSPEREDPGNPSFSTGNIPKIVGGLTPDCLEIANALYSAVLEQTVPVSSPSVAEAAKIVENIYRSVNIALVNELKVAFTRMGIDVWDVINAAKTKPFGFQAFYPGPGLGGHCIPIDPFYLTWKAREFKTSTRFIELAGEINTAMPEYVVERTMDALNLQGKPLKGSKILVAGVAYKKNIDDLRESPALEIIDLMINKEAEVSYSDPYIPKIPRVRKYDLGLSNTQLTVEAVQELDAVILTTDHDDFPYEIIQQNASLIIDTRNAFRSRGIKGPNIVLA